jgi:signal peptidase II
MLRTGLLIAAGIVIADQALKYWVLEILRLSPPGCLESHLGCRQIEVSGVFDLTMVWNYGVSFGLLKADHDIARWGLVLLSLAISAFFVSWLRSAERRLQMVALGLVIGGAIGNVIDRIRFGAVVDFLDFSGIWRPYFFNYVFNVADAAITIGASLLILDFLMPDAARRKTAA